MTGKNATLGEFSREAMLQPNAAKLIVDSMQRAVVRKADLAFLGNADAPDGLLNISGIGAGGAVGDDLDTLTEAITSIEAAGGQATGIIAAPDAWGSLSKLKSGADFATTLLGAGTDAAERRLLGVPVHTTSAMPSGTLLVLSRGPCSPCTAT